VFDQLFERPHALARHRAGPLVEERLRYLVHLSGQGHALATRREAAVFTLIVTDRLHLADRPGQLVTPAEIRRAAARWGTRASHPPRRNGGRRSRERFLDHATQFLRFLGRLEMPVRGPRPHAHQIDAFADYLIRERGLSPRTRDFYCPVVERFLEDLRGAGHTLKELTATRIDEALVARVARSGYARRTVQSLTTALRAFFFYAHRRGWCRTGLAEAIRAPRVFAQESLPRGPSWEDVRRVLATTEGDDPKAIRDRAVLRLLTVYGFRAGEVTRLRLEDFDWERELLAVTRSKTQRPQTYPLSRPVGDAVLRYLRQCRPRSSFREIFLTLAAPRRPLTRGALWSIVGRRLRALGASLPHHGPHALRHACATHLLSEGLSLKEIGDHLGHTHPDATRTYAKVDLTGLRQVADFDLGGLT
jgi:integrase/recombinase XerD